MLWTVSCWHEITREPHTFALLGLCRRRPRVHSPKAGIHPPDRKPSNQALNVVGWTSRSKQRRRKCTTTRSVRLNLSHTPEPKDVKIACTRSVGSKKISSVGSISTAQRRDAEVSNIAATFRPLMDPRQLVVADLETMVVARSPVGHHGT